ncbi:MAG: hypothetical protein U1G07_21805 [Verrucomicrobiota bacterium]
MAAADATEGVTEWVPNGSFECGTANWGSTWGLSGWAGNLPGWKDSSLTRAPNTGSTLCGWRFHHPRNAPVLLV